MVLFVWVVQRRDLRTSSLGVLRAFFQWPVFVNFSIIALYSAVVVELLVALRLWDLSSFRDSNKTLCGD